MKQQNLIDPFQEETANEEDIIEEEELGVEKKKSRAARKSERERKEKEIQEIELAALTEDKKPETAGDFEKLLLSSPNDSYLWIQFMAFHVSMFLAL